MDSEYRFPPFPVQPDGVAIVPFSAFTPAGYTTAPSGDIEVDAWAGIPTVKVLNEQEVSQIRKAKKRRKNAGHATDAAGRLIPWWEEWEEGEAQRATSESSFERSSPFVVSCPFILTRRIATPDLRIASVSLQMTLESGAPGPR